MTDVIMELYAALEQLRETLTSVEVSNELKQTVEDLVRPIFENESSRQRVTEIINDVGDFSENVLVPLLEQYISANVALRVKFLIEDLLVFIEGYRDSLVRKIEREKKQRTGQRTVAAGTLTFRANTMHRLAANSATNHYRKALTQREKPRTFSSFQTSRSQPIPAARGSASNLGRLRPLKLNNFTGVNKSVERSQSFRMPEKVPKRESEPAPMASVVYNDSTKELENAMKPRPTLQKSGQVLVKVTAIGLNAFDLPSTLTPDDSNAADPPHVTQIKAISNSFLQLAGKSRTRREKTQKGPEDDTVGQEFCGVIEDIAWKRGDFMHTNHVAKGSFVYGVTTSGRGALGEYLACDINNVARVPGPVSTPSNAARLGLDGAVVCQALAATDITNTRGTRVLVIGGATNIGMILLELLNKDLRIPYPNLHAVTTVDEVELLTNGGLLDRNVHSFDNYLERIQNDTLDIVFDCYSEVDPLNRSFNSLLASKKRRTCQFVTLNAAKLVREKKAKQENWQKEFNLLNKLVKTRKLSLGMFGNGDVVEFDAAAIEDAYSSIRRGDISGKAIVEINERNVRALQERLNE